MSRRPARAARFIVAAAATTLSIPFAPARATAISWSSPASGQWLDPANWSPAAMPTSADPVTIDAPGGPYTVTLDASAPAGPLTLNNPAATLLLDTPPSTSVTLATTGDINIAAGTLALHNYHSNLFVQSPSPNSQINLTNAGRIDCTMDLPFQSFPAATFDNLANVSNSGTIEVYDAPVGQPDVVLKFKSADIFTSNFTNTGTLRTGTRSRIEVNVATFNQNAGAIDGTLSFYGNAFNYNGGSLGTVILNQGFSTRLDLTLAPTVGAGTFVARTNAGLWINSDLAPNQTVYISPSSRGALTSPALTNAGRLVVGADPLATSASLSRSTLLSLPYPTDTLTNTGTLDINSPLSTPSTITGNVNNTGVVHIATPYPNIASFTNYPTSLAGNWTNNGSISIDAGTCTLLSTGSNFTQNAGASLTVAAEPLTLTNAHFYYNGGSVSGNVALNNSTLHFAPGLTSAGGTFTSSPTSTAIKPFDGDIPAGATVVHNYTLPTPTFLLSSFSNAGSLRTSMPVSLTYRPIYRLDNLTGTLTNTGSLGGTSNGVDRGIVLELDGNLTNTGDIKAYNLTVYKGTFNQNAGTLNVDNLCTISQGTFNYNGGTLTGKPVALSASTLNIAPNTNPASFQFYNGNNTLHGAPAPGSVLSLDVLSPSPAATVSVTADPFTNAGTLSFASTTGACTSTLTIPNSGTLTNTGTLSVTKGLGGTRTLNANIINTGTFSVGPGTTLTLAGSLTTSTPLDLQGTLDLRGPLAWTYAGPSPADTVRALLAAARLVNTTADAAHRLGYVDTGSAVTVSLTLTGDANCDGKLDADDFALLDKGFAQHASSWWLGDFNYDGQVTSADYLLLDTAYLQKQGGAPSLAFLSQRESQFGPDYVSALLASVPEPSSALAAILVVIPAITRRRRSGL